MVVVSSRTHLCFPHECQPNHDVGCVSYGPVSSVLLHRSWNNTSVCQVKRILWDKLATGPTSTFNQAVAEEDQGDA